MNLDKLVRHRLDDIILATDTEMRPNQIYNIPHFADFGLVFEQVLYKPVPEVGYEQYGYQYRIGNLYYPWETESSAMGWKDRIFMNEDIKMGNRYYYPFLIFVEDDENNLYRMINVNKVSVTISENNHAHLIIQEGEEYHNTFSDVSKIKMLLTPFSMEYACSDGYKDNFIPYNGTAMNFSSDGLYNSSLYEEMGREVYETIKFNFDDNVSMYIGMINYTDKAIHIDTGEFGVKVYIESIILFNREGYLIGDTSNYLTEKENNIFEINPLVDMHEWSYIIFYYKESEKSVDHLYSFPKYIIDHDTEERIKGTGEYILGEELFEAMIDPTDSLTVEDLRQQYRENASGYLAPYNEFLEKWLERVVRYRYSLIEDIYNDDIIDPRKDLSFKSVNYTVGKLRQKMDMNGEVTFRRTMWHFYDDESYSGYNDIMLFINGFLHMEFLRYEWDSRYYRILVDNITDAYMDTDIVELVFITNVRDKIAEMIIPISDNNVNTIHYDRYYHPYTCNYFAEEKEYRVAIQDQDNPTLYQPIYFNYKNVKEGTFEVNFGEIWSKLPVDRVHFDQIAMTAQMVLSYQGISLGISSYYMSQFFAPPVPFDADSFSSPSIESPISGETTEQFTITTATNSGYSLFFTEDNKVYTKDRTEVNGISGNIVGWADNFAKEIITAFLTDINHIYEVNNTTGDLVNDINIDITFLASNEETAMDNIRIPFECTTVYIEETQTLIAVETGWTNSIPRYIHAQFNGKECLNYITQTFPEDICIIDSTIIKYNESEILIYGGKATYHGETNYIYRYNFRTNELIRVCEIPETAGVEGASIHYHEGKLYVFGGLNTSRSTECANTVATYTFDADNWECYIINDTVFIDSTIVESENSVAVIGGYSSKAIDINRVKDEAIIFDKKDLYKCNLGRGKRVKLPHPMVGVRAIANGNNAFIIGNRFTADRTKVYKMNIDTGAISQFGNDIAYEYEWCDIVQLKGNNLEWPTALYLQHTEDIQYSYSKIVEFKEEKIRDMFTDQYGDYYIIVRHFIYTYKDNKWDIIGDINRIDEMSPLKKIRMSGDIFVALLENGQLLTSPNLDFWYDYKLKCIPLDKENDKIVDIKFYNGSVSSSPSDGKATKPVLLEMKSGDIYFNPYPLNMSSIYDNVVKLVSTKRFAYQVDFIQYNEDDRYNPDGLVLNSDFAYCTNPDNYFLSYNGRMLEKSAYTVVVPERNTPINGIYIYFNFDITENCVINTVYLPFDTNIVYRSPKLESNGLIKVQNTSQFNVYGFKRDYYWIFSQGKKIPYKNLQDVSNNIIKVNANVNMWTQDKDAIPSPVINKINGTMEIMNNNDAVVVEPLNRLHMKLHDNILSVRFKYVFTMSFEFMEGYNSETIRFRIMDSNNEPIMFFGSSNDDYIMVGVLVNTNCMIRDTDIYLFAKPGSELIEMRYQVVNSDTGDRTMNTIKYSDIEWDVETFFEGEFDIQIMDPTKLVNYKDNALTIIKTQDLTMDSSTYEVDEFNRLMDYFIAKLPDWGVDQFFVENISNIKDIDATLEEKIILLKIYSDHYIANADKRNDLTPPFELDNEYTHYPVLDGNKE